MGIECSECVVVKGARYKKASGKILVTSSIAICWSSCCQKRHDLGFSVKVSMRMHQRRSKCGGGIPKISAGSCSTGAKQSAIIISVSCRDCATELFQEIMGSEGIGAQRGRSSGCCCCCDKSSRVNSEISKDWQIPVVF